MWVSARAARSIVSGDAPPVAMMDTSGDANASIENEAMESSEPTDRSSQSWVSALIKDDSSPG